MAAAQYKSEKHWTQRSLDTEQHNAQRAGFESFPDGLLDHHVDAADRLENDLEGLALDDMPELASDLEPAELDLVMEMENNIAKAQQQSLQRRRWNPESVDDVEQYLRDTTQRQEPSQEDEDKRTTVLAQVDRLVQAGLAGFSGMHVKPYGSFVSGLYTSNGDVDISVEGIRTGRDPSSGAYENVPVHELDKEEKIQLLKALGSKLTRNNLVEWRGNIGVERILHARVPIIKFRHAQTGLDCDISIASTGARFKSTVLGYLCGIDWRFPAVVRLVKLWASTCGMNDATAGTFNSFALTLMVAFHLQTQAPPILPPICDLFDQDPDVLRGRPLHAGQQAKEGVLEACGETAAQHFQDFGAANDANVTELLASFFVLYHTCISQWCRDRHNGMRSVRISTWSGEWTYRHWAKRYCVGLEDPFDCTDNCARTIAAHASASVAKAFGKAATSMLVISETAVTSESADRPSLVQQLFTKQPPKPRAARGGRGGGRGGGRPGEPVRVIDAPVYGNRQPPYQSETSQVADGWSEQVPVSNSGPTSAMQQQSRPEPIHFSNSPILSQPPPPPPRPQPATPSQQHETYNRTQPPAHNHVASPHAPYYHSDELHQTQFPTRQDTPSVQRDSFNHAPKRLFEPPLVPVNREGSGHAPLYHREQPSFGPVEVLPARQPRQQQHHSQLQQPRQQPDQHQSQQQQSYGHQERSGSHDNRQLASGPVAFEHVQQQRVPDYVERPVMQHTQHTGLSGNADVHSEGPTSHTGLMQRATTALTKGPMSHTGLMHRTTTAQEARDAAAMACNPSYHPQQQHPSHNGSHVPLTDHPQLTTESDAHQPAHRHRHTLQHAQQDVRDTQHAVRSASGRVLLVHRQSAGQSQPVHGTETLHVGQDHVQRQDLGVASDQQQADWTQDHAGDDTQASEHAEDGGRRKQKNKDWWKRNRGRGYRRGQGRGRGPSQQQS